MNDTPFLTFQKFSDKALALELIAVLKSNNLDCVFEDATPHFDHTFANNQTNNEYLVKLKSSDFEIADKILTEMSSENLDAVEPNHYLFDFSDDELRDLLRKSDEWSRYDYLLAQKILTERGFQIDEKAVGEFKKQRIDDLARPEKSQRLSIIAGYVFAVFGGVIAIFIGWHLFSNQKTLPNGERVHSYIAADRKQGKVLVVIGTLSAIAWTAFRIFKA